MEKFSCVHVENLNSNVKEAQFWKGVNVWIRSPHVENRRLCGVKTLVSGIVLDARDANLIECLVKISLQHSSNFTGLISIQTVLEHCGIKLGPLPANKDFPDAHTIILKVRELCPKNSSLFRPCLEAIVLDGVNTQATFIHLGPFNDTLSPRTPYKCQYKRLSDAALLEFGLWAEGESREEGADLWLKSKLFPRLIKWITLEHNPSSVLPDSSLNLLDLNQYNEKYQELKKKYGPQMVEIWPEQTDPLKFVYEDLAIASYLLCIWGRQEKKVSFIDLGCGNGLLVHILSGEGHPGLGVDVRSRKLWSLYPPTTRLEICSVVPSLDTVYPEYDWIIGNHSDELTPWIPVMSALSSPQSCFFLLPCCAYDFWGKYQRINATKSQYTEYIMFIKDVAETSGFKVEIDKLRIPSTKRTCLIGRQRIKHVEKTMLWEYVTSRKQCDQEEFTPRSAVEPVRNCSKLASGVTESVLKLIVEEMLRDFHEGDSWWTGGDLSLSTAASLLPATLKAQMKSECGGLQTLLKNHHNIFIVQGGVVKFRHPKPSNPSLVVKWKNKPCWFFQNHPQSCPLQENQCSFDHTKP